MHRGKGMVLILTCGFLLRQQLASENWHADYLQHRPIGRAWSNVGKTTPR
jgi:hypothetical protein